jgi:hypothetical protein
MTLSQGDYKSKKTVIVNKRFKINALKQNLPSTFIEGKFY